MCVCGWLSVKDHGECSVKIYRARANVKPCFPARACCLVHLVCQKTHAAFQLSHLSEDTDGKQPRPVGEFNSTDAAPFTYLRKERKPTAHSFILIWLNHQHGFMRQNLLAVSFSTQDYQSDPFEGHVSLKAVTYASLCRIKAQPLLISVSVGKENRSELRNKSPRLTVAAVESTLLLWSSNNVFRSFLNPQFPFWISHNLLLAQVRRLCLSKLCTWTFFSVISPPFLFPCRRCYIFLLNVLPLAEVLDACKTATKASLSRRDGFFSPRLNLNSFPLSCCFCWSNWILANEGGF